jgi:hypothetical protein
MKIPPMQDDHGWEKSMPAKMTTSPGGCPPLMIKEKQASTFVVVVETTVQCGLPLGTFYT